jgi:hypothetical protein
MHFLTYSDVFSAFYVSNGLPYVLFTPKSRDNVQKFTTHKRRRGTDFAPCLATDRILLCGTARHQGCDRVLSFLLDARRDAGCLI